jgi:uncharacterized protein
MVCCPSVAHPSGALPAPCWRDTARAMSRENVERSRLAYEAFTSALATGDWEAFSEFVHPDFQWKAVQDLNPYQGLDGMKASLAGWSEAWESWRSAAEEFIDAGDSVIIAHRIQGRARQSGLELDSRYYLVCDIREGKLWRLRQFFERAEALETVGRSEKDLKPGLLARLGFRRFRGRSDAP